MTEFKKKALTAVERCIDNRGYALFKSSPNLKDGGYTDIVANDGNSIVFVEVIAKDGAARAFPRSSTASASAKQGRWRPYAGLSARMAGTAT